MKKVSLKEYADKYNDQLTRRGKRMSESYIYRVIREDMSRKPNVRRPWFEYRFEGNKDRVWIMV